MHLRSVPSYGLLLTLACSTPSVICPVALEPAATPVRNRTLRAYEPETTHGRALCTSDGALPGQTILAGLSPSGEPPDSIELRSGPRALGRAGWRCARAPDPLACDAAFASTVAVAPYAWPMQGSSPMVYLLIERHGRFTTVADPWNLQQWLGPIDTLEEAALLAWVRGYEPWCAGDGSRGQAQGEGWALTATSGTTSFLRPVDGAPGHVFLLQIHVSRDGTMSLDPIAYVDGIR